MITIPESIKSLLKSDSSRKNFRVHFPNGEREDITNANIVSESVTLTESICSTQQLKIGMCETPSIEFETLGVGYIRGAEIECSLEVICDSTVSGAVYREDIDQYVYPIPYGTFIVDSCKKQADMSHRQIVAYNKIAYKSWEFNDYTKNILSLGMYWYKSKLKISLEGLLKLIVPDMNANFEEMSQSAVHREGLVGEYYSEAKSQKLGKYLLGIACLDIQNVEMIICLFIRQLVILGLLMTQSLLIKLQKSKNI